LELVAVYRCHIRSPRWRVSLSKDRNETDAGPFCAPRQDKAIEVIKALTAQVSLRVFSLIDHAFWWLVGRTVGTPNFRQQVEEAKKSQLIRPVANPPALRFRATERIRLLGSCFPN
ncbi:hypothetical protein, partial [Rhodovulum bhavnagarense]|uniref:hypothetical protein n=1 Tax=Rhodovulum bhavnagarense TaxID=992286 RepID=UPI001AA00098